MREICFDESYSNRQDYEQQYCHHYDIASIAVHFFRRFFDLKQYLLEIKK